MKEEFNVSKRFFDDLVLQYALMYIQTDKLLTNYFKQKKEEQHFPIDYFDFAKWLKIKVIGDDLNYFNNNNGYFLGWIEIKKDSAQAHMHIDFTSKYSSGFLRNYVVCYEVSSYLLGLQDNIASKYFTKNMINEDVFLIEAFTAFLILPPILTYKEKNNYIMKNKVRNVEMEEIMKVLSLKTKIPVSKIISSYKYIEILFSYLSTNSGKDRLNASFKRNYPECDKDIQREFKKLLKQPITIK